MCPPPAEYFSSEPSENLSSELREVVHVSTGMMGYGTLRDDLTSSFSDPSSHATAFNLLRLSVPSVPGCPLGSPLPKPRRPPGPMHGGGRLACRSSKHRGVQWGSAGGGLGRPSTRGLSGLWRALERFDG